MFMKFNVVPVVQGKLVQEEAESFYLDSDKFRGASDEKMEAAVKGEISVATRVLESKGFSSYKVMEASPVESEIHAINQQSSVKSKSSLSAQGSAFFSGQHPMLLAQKI